MCLALPSVASNLELSLTTLCQSSKDDHRLKKLGTLVLEKTIPLPPPPPSRPSMVLEIGHLLVRRTEGGGGTEAGGNLPSFLHWPKATVLEKLLPLKKHTHKKST